MVGRKESELAMAGTSLVKVQRMVIINHMKNGVNVREGTKLE